jgi:hypothetical protein
MTAQTARSHSILSANPGTVSQTNTGSHTAHHATPDIPMAVTHEYTQTNKTRKMEPLSQAPYRTLKRASTKEQRKLKNQRENQLKLVRRTSACHMGGRHGAAMSGINIGRMGLEEWMRSRSKKFPHHPDKILLNKIKKPDSS